MRLSKAQQRVIDAMKAGERLCMSTTPSTYGGYVIAYFFAPANSVGPQRKVSSATATVLRNRKIIVMGGGTPEGFAIGRVRQYLLATPPTGETK